MKPRKFRSLATLIQDRHPRPNHMHSIFPLVQLVWTPDQCSPQQRPYAPPAAAARTGNAQFGQESGPGRQQRRALPPASSAPAQPHQQHPSAPTLPPHEPYAAAAAAYSSGSIPQWSPVLGHRCRGPSRMGRSAGGRGGGSIGMRIDSEPVTFPASDRIVVP
ncbi:hypothetical protein EDD15DRAFT_1066528 [Pisolithus albus]|nr:hypothetical protein EDD15DRAFT_1066528 [Pisolithus albus]